VFRRDIFPVLTPLAVGPGQPFPYISGLSLSLGLFVRDPETGEPHTAHTTFDVPIIVAGAAGALRINSGRLADVAPTLLDLMGIEKPHEMAGYSLIVRQASHARMRI